MVLKRTCGPKRYYFENGMNWASQVLILCMRSKKRN